MDNKSAVIRNVLLGHLDVEDHILQFKVEFDDGGNEILKFKKDDAIQIARDAGVENLFALDGMLCYVNGNGNGNGNGKKSVVIKR